MKRAAEKLKSSRGASLMMALLLFLTCAVVGSAVLTAGTAALGVAFLGIVSSSCRFVC